MAHVTAVATPLPLERVLWVRVEVDETGPVGAVVAGIRRRHPVTLRVGAHVAQELSDAGVPTVTRWVGTTS